MSIPQGWQVEFTGTRAVVTAPDGRGSVLAEENDRRDIAATILFWLVRDLARDTTEPHDSGTEIARLRSALDMKCVQLDAMDSACPCCQRRWGRMFGAGSRDVPERGSSAPAGFKLVPLEATDDMVANIRRRQLAVRASLGAEPIMDDKWVYAAMIAVAPTPPFCECKVTCGDSRIPTNATCAGKPNPPPTRCHSDPRKKALDDLAAIDRELGLTDPPHSGRGSVPDKQWIPFEPHRGGHSDA